MSLQNELLTKIDPTEYLKEQVGWLGRLRRRGVAERFKWLPTVRPLQHLANRDALAPSPGSLSSACSIRVVVKIMVPFWVP